ncbi:MAG TPA: hypothetical protein VK659_13830 [Asanoa sp.]|nr:hypothetical protein [Asanoa sp.]
MLRTILHIVADMFVKSRSVWTKEQAMAEAGVWVAWGIPARGRERQALDLLKHSTTDYLERLVQDGRIERFDTAILKPQSTELGGFVLIQGTKQQIDALRGDHDFGRWVTQVQLVADKVGIVDAWVNQGLPEAIDLYEDALKRLD